MRRNFTWPFIFLAIGLFLASFAFTVGRLATPDPVDQSNATNMAGTERLAAEAKITLRYKMPDGRQASEENRLPTGADVNATLADLRKAHTNWSILKFTTNELLAEVRCTTQTGGYLGAKDGWVAVYDGSPGPCRVLRELTEIPVDSVHPEERGKLDQEVLKFTDDNNLQELLDGLISD